MAKLKFVLIAIVFFTVVGYLIYSGLQRATVYYNTVEEVLSGNYHKEAKSFRVSGTVVPGSAQVRPDKMALDFRLAGRTPDQTIPVRYHGVVPDNFKEGMNVVAEGKYNPISRQFEAGTILLKCPSKYEKQQ